MGRNGTCVSEMTYTVYVPLPKIQLTLLHIRETERYPKLQKLNPNFHMAKNYPSSNFLSFSDHSGPLAGKKIAL